MRELYRVTFSSLLRNDHVDHPPETVPFHDRVLVPSRLRRLLRSPWVPLVVVLVATCSGLGLRPRSSRS